MSETETDENTCEVPEFLVTDEEVDITLDDVAGLDEQTARIRETVIQSATDDCAGYGLQSALIWGPPGVGDSFLARATAGELIQEGFEYIRLESLDAPMSPSQFARETLEFAKRQEPAVVHVECFDEIVEMYDDVLDTLEEKMAELTAANRDIVFLASMSGTGTDVSHRAHTIATFPKVRVAVPMPGVERRRLLFGRAFDGAVEDDVLAESCLELNTEALASKTEQFNVADIFEVVQRSINTELAARDGRVELPISVGQTVVESVIETMKDEQLSNRDRWTTDVVGPFGAEDDESDEAEREVPDVTFDDIGGLDDAIETLQRRILAPLEYPDRYEAVGLDGRAGALMTGPPGTGKTMLAKAFANETNRHFVNIDGNEVTSMYYGQSSENLHQFFEDARENAPALVFIDEVETLAPERGSDEGTEATSRLTSQLLRELDGMDELGDVFVLAATNTPENLDSAVLRPGRLGDVHVEVLPPETREDLADVLEIHLRGRPTAADVTPDWVADQLPLGVSGALAENICDMAASEAVWPPESDDVVITREDFETVFDSLPDWEETEEKERTYY